MGHSLNCYKCMTYRAINKDGTYKYMQLSHSGGAGWYHYVKCFENYSEVGKTYENLCYLSDTTPLAQYFDPSTQNGKLFITATPRFFCMFNVGHSIGSYEGQGATAVVEIEKVHPLDQTPAYGWLNTYNLCRYGSYGISLTRSNLYKSPSAYVTLATPIGTLGYMGNQCINAFMPNQPINEAFGVGLHHIYDFHLTMDPTS